MFRLAVGDGLERFNGALDPVGELTEGNLSAAGRDVLLAIQTLVRKEFLDQKSCQQADLRSFNVVDSATVASDSCVQSAAAVGSKHKH